MSGFIQVHADGTESLINTAYIIQLYKKQTGSGSIILTTNGYACSEYHVSESYSQVKKLVEGSSK